MSGILLHAYPGDHVLEWLAVTSFGAVMLSVLAWLASRRLERRPATRHLVLVSALLGCLGLPVLAMGFGVSGISLVSLPVLPVQADGGNDDNGPSVERIDPIRTTGKGRFRVASRIGPLNMPGPVIAHPSVEPAETTRSTPPQVPSPEGAAKNHVESRWSFRETASLALVVWGLGSLVLMLRFSRACVRLARWRRAANSRVSATVQTLVEGVCRQVGLGEPPRLLLSREVSAPLAFGVLDPVVMLPEGLIESITEHELRDVLLHEIAHVRRRDPLVVLVQELVRALYWPILSVHALIRELGRAREELCDNHVLQSRDAVSYGETLLHLAELSRPSRPLMNSVGILNWRGELERRISGFLEQGRSTMTSNPRSLVCLVALAIVAGGVITSTTRLRAGGQDAPKASVKAAGETSETGSAKGETEEKPDRGTMRVRILGPDGEPMSGVKVLRAVWTRPQIDDHTRNFVSNERGEVVVDLPKGMDIYRLWAWTDGYVPLFAHWEEEDDPDRTMPEEFTFRLERGTTIGGVILDPDGQPVSSASVEVMLDDNERSEARTVPNTWLATGDDAVKTDHEGRWTLDNVPPGEDVKVRVKIHHPDFISDPEWGTFQDEQGVDMKALRAGTAKIVLKRGHAVTGTVLDANGQPVADAVVVQGDRPYRQVGSQEVRTDNQGRYQLPPLPAERKTITVIAPGWAPKQKKVDIEPGMDPVDFQLEPGKDLKIRFVDQAGELVPEVFVGIESWRGGEALYNNRHPNVLNTQIPDRADKTGVYHWSWAPDDVVTYQFSREGYAVHTLALAADGREQTVTMPNLRIHGTVTDRTGRPIHGVTAIPVLELRPGFLYVERRDARGPFEGTYSIEADRTDVAYRVRIEAEGYRSAMSETFAVGAADPSYNFQLEPAPAVKGRVIDSEGQPVQDVRVYLATSSQNLDKSWHTYSGSGSNNQKILTDEQGRFSFPAQFERCALVAVHDLGYAEVHLDPDQQPGDVALKPWATIEGRLMQDGQGVPSTWVNFSPVRVLGGTHPHIQDDFGVKTDAEGRFVFEKVPPLKGSLSAQLSVWRESPLTSSQSIPLDLHGGEHLRIDLGSGGTTISGKVVPTGEAAGRIDLSRALNWLVRRGPGIEPPEELRGFSAQNGWQETWRDSQEGIAFLQTLNSSFVVLDAEGRFQIHGVTAGDYDLALHLYEAPGDGCLINPFGMRTLRLQVSEEQASGGRVDLGEIEVSVKLHPEAGDEAPDFSIVPFSGAERSLKSLRGHYVLLDFWANWCSACVEDRPKLKALHEAYGRDHRLAVVGLNLDSEPAETRALLERNPSPWLEGRPGGSPEEQVNILTRYTINTLPEYLLIGPDGRVIHRGHDIGEIRAVLQRVLD